MPFLSVGGNLGWREEVSRGVSELSGEYCVENVRGEDGELYRRLIFLHNVTLVQSESRLVSSNTGQFFLLVHCNLLCSLSVPQRQPWPRHYVFGLYVFTSLLLCVRSTISHEHNISGTLGGNFFKFQSFTQNIYFYNILIGFF